MWPILFTVYGQKKEIHKYNCVAKDSFQFKIMQQYLYLKGYFIAFIYSKSKYVLYRSEYN